ncbi:MAG: hypothetical protein WBD07_18265 [Vicinamibacterales bacterium]
MTRSKAVDEAVQTAQSASAAARAAMEALSTAEQKLRAEHREEINQRDKITNLPPPVDDVVQQMRACVDAYAAQAAAEYRRGVVHAFGGELYLQGDGTYVPKPPGLYRPPAPVGHTPFMDLCAFAPALMKERLEQIIRSEAYEAGPPIADRLRLIAEADARIRAKEDEHTQLVDTAAAFDPPIVMQLLPAARERREQERRTREEQERIAAVNRQNDQEYLAQRAIGIREPRVAPSEYLRTGRV